MKITLKHFSLAGYKAFPAETTALQLAPITLVIGHNNAGKSALVRAPVLLADSLGDDSRLLSLNARGLDFAQGYAELFHGGAAHSDLSFQLGLQVGERAMTLSVVLGFLSSRNAPRSALVVRSFDLAEDGAGAATAPLPGLPLHVGLVPRQSPPYHAFNATLAGKEASPAQPWDRLLPLPRWLLEELGNLSGGAETVSTLLDLRELGKWIHHLGPFRAVAQRQYKVPDVAPLMAGDGAGAVELLAMARRDGGQLLDKVSAWFSLNPHFGFTLDPVGSSETAGIMSLMLLGSSGIPINLADAGSGVAQVLPLVVRRFDEQAADVSPTLQIVEQPELHLHPAACASLGDLFVDMAAEHRASVLVETHSENLVLRIRRRIAEGKLDPDKVAIYWVENETGTSATFRQLSMGKDGWVEDWPEGVFAEDAEEARALARAMRGGS